MKAARWHLSIIAATLTTLMLVPIAGQSATEKAQKVSSPVARKITQQPQEIAIQLKQLSAPLITGGSKFPQQYFQATPLQAGDNIATATPITSLPFTGTGTTVGYTDDYDEACDAWAQCPDVVYSYTPTVDEPINISLCNSSYMTHLWVYENDSTNLFACNRFDASCSGSPRSALFELPFTAGNIYYIVIDGEGIGMAGDYEINMEVNVPPVSLSLHPAFGDAGNGKLVFAYEDHDDNALYWTGSGDDGQTLTPSVYWDFSEMPTYPSVEYWGDDSIFYGTFTSPHQSADPTASATYLLKIGNPANTNSYDLSFWLWASLGWHDLKMADIACNDGLEDWNWGIISMIHSSTHGTEPLVDAPHIAYQVDSTGGATLSWYSGVNGCATTDAFIDRVTHKAYSVYDIYDDEASQWVMILRVDRTDDWTIESDAWIYSVGGTNEHVQHPKDLT